MAMNSYGAADDDLVDGVDLPQDPVPSPSAPEATAAEPLLSEPETLVTPSGVVDPPPGDSVPTSPAGGVEVDGKPDPAAPVEPVVPVETATFTPELLARAGMTADDASKSFGSPEALQRALDFYDQKLYRDILSSGQRPPAAGQGGVPQPPQAAVPTPAATAPPPPAQPSANVPNVPEFKAFEFPAELFDPEAKPVFDQMTQHYADQIRQLHEYHQAQLQSSLSQHQSVLQQMAGQLVQQRNEEIQREMDAEFSRQPKEWEAIFGAGDVNAVRNNTQQLENRRRLHNAMGTIVQGLQQRGLPIPSFSELFAKARAAEFSQDFDAIVRSSINLETQQRKRQFTTPPSKTGGPQKAPVRRAADFATNFLADRGVTAASSADGLGNGEF